MDDRREARRSDDGLSSRAGDDEDVGGDETGTSDEIAVVGAAFDVLGDPDPELRGKGAMRPPLNETREDVLPLAREPGRNGDVTLGEWASAATLVGDGGATTGNFAEGEGVLLRMSGEEGIVSSGLSAGA